MPGLSCRTFVSNGAEMKLTASNLSPSLKRRGMQYGVGRPIASLRLGMRKQSACSSTRPDEIIGKSLLTLVPPERMDQARLAIDRLQKGGWYDQYETVRLRKDGIPVPVELTVSPIRDADGTVLGVATVCRDITVRQHYEEALRESEERFSKVFKLAPIAMSISTLDEGRYLDVNESLLAVTGYSREEVVGHTARDLKVFADPEDGLRIRELLAGGEPLRGLELRLRGKNGDVRTSLLAADIIELKDKRCLLTASVDITDRKEREATLQFLDALGKETAKIADADAILSITTRMLGEHLSVAVCAYADMDADEDGFTIRGNWSAPGSMSIVGHYSLAAFGKLAVKNLHAGLPLILHDNRAQLPADEAATFLRYWSRRHDLHAPRQGRPAHGADGHP